jgi:PilZ domain
MLQQKPGYSRRFTKRLRVEATDGVWVYWSCGGREDLSRVADLSAGGLFIESKRMRRVDEKTSLHFLVQEGQIRADAIVRHVRRDIGLGLRFTNIAEADRPHLNALLQRLRAVPPKAQH